MIYLDTHVVAWLYAGQIEGLTGATRALLDSEPLLISPMVGLELELLFERGRVLEPAAQVLLALSGEFGLAICDLAFPVVASRARDERWTRDPFDRLIVAQARVRDAPLLTRDRTILERYSRAVWPSA